MSGELPRAAVHFGPRTDRQPASGGCDPGRKAVHRAASEVGIINLASACRIYLQGAEFLVNTEEKGSLT